eukprot:gene4105-14206_t
MPSRARAHADGGRDRLRLREVVQRALESFLTGTSTSGATEREVGMRALESFCGEDSLRATERWEGGRAEGPGVFPAGRHSPPVQRKELGHGTQFRPREVVLMALEYMLPDDIHLRCNGKVFMAVTSVWPQLEGELRVFMAVTNVWLQLEGELAQHVFMAVTNVWPQLEGELVSQFESREDLIDSVLISCHIPWYFDGSLATKYRDGYSFDGGLTNLIPVVPGNGNAVRISCFPGKRMTSFGEIHIAPDTYDDW